MRFWRNLSPSPKALLAGAVGGALLTVVLFVLNETFSEDVIPEPHAHPDMSFLSGKSGGRLLISAPAALLFQTLALSRLSGPIGDSHPWLVLSICVIIVNAGFSAFLAWGGSWVFRVGRRLLDAMAPGEVEDKTTRRCVSCDAPLAGALHTCEKCGWTQP